MGLLAVGLGSLQYVLQEGQLDDWFSSLLILRLAILGGVSLTAFVIWELWPGNPPSLPSTCACWETATCSADHCWGRPWASGWSADCLSFPLFVQGILHFTATETGIVLLPGGAGDLGRHRVLRERHSKRHGPAPADRGLA